MLNTATKTPIQSKSHHQTVIEAKPGWQVIDWAELRQYRDLFYFLVLRDIKVLYKQTVLGFAWAIIRPVFSMIVFSVVFGRLAQIPSDGVPYPIFSYTALVPWTYFSAAMSSSTSSLVSNAQMLSKIYFPRLIIPLTPVLAKLVDFAIAFLILILMMVWFGIAPTLNVLALPLLVLLMVTTAAGVGMWLSALAIQYRDVNFAMQFVSQLLMYAAPVVWPASLIIDNFGYAAYLAYGLYPMAGVIEGFRAALLGTVPMPWDLIGMGALSATVLLVSGAFYFRRMERFFADVA
ncbi:MAG: ABC transporter permease [Anaerolineales bacterium]|nr:ABC transporter permease [Anaerolineales bacterium]